MRIGILALLSVLLLSACAPGKDPVPTDSTVVQPSQTVTDTSQNWSPQPGQTLCLEVLSRLWQNYPDEFRFSVFGGSRSKPVSDGPGALPQENLWELEEQYHYPREMTGEVTAAASLTHLLNANLFACAAVELSQPDNAAAVAEKWREGIQKNFWVCGQPERLLLARAEGCLVMAYGLEDSVETLEQTLAQQFPQVQILVSEEILA